MFATFKMDLPKLSENTMWEEYYKKGLEIYNEHEKCIKESLDKYLSPNGELKASEIEKDWFPDFKADVFLSHSHKDERDVIIFAGFLSELGLTPFIDSCAWGYANDLLKQIDNRYCVLRKNADGTVKTYDYDERNQSTAHVHMILNGALMKMIDNTECLIFLETPNSLKVKDVSDTTTNSAWIYSELLMSKYLNRKKPIRKKRAFVLNESFEHGGMNVVYDVDVTHLIVISMKDIIDAAKSGYSGLGRLDQLYLKKKIYEER